MKYLVYGIIYMIIKILYFFWELKFDNYSFKNYLEDIDNFEYPIDYP